MFETQLPQHLSLLPNLVSLDVPFSPPLFTSSDATSLSRTSFPRLERLATSIKSENGTLDVDKLAQLAVLPALKQLKICNWNVGDDSEVHRATTTLLPGIQSLEIEGNAADLDLVQFVVNSCPSILHLELNSTYDDVLEYSSHLSLLPSDLQSLFLRGSSSTYSPVDSSLPRFSQLRSLRLGDKCYSRDVHLALQQLPLLAHIHLGEGRIDCDGFQSLFSGPSRLAHLRTITLDFLDGSIGEKISAPSSSTSDAESERERCSIEMYDWELPDFADYGRYSVLGLRRLVDVAEENGVEVTGTFLQAIEFVYAYRIEENNRTVVQAYLHKSLDHLRWSRLEAEADGVPLPDLDIDSLDKDHLEIVETGLPEQEWFVLSLKNKEEVGAEREE